MMMIPTILVLCAVAWALLERLARHALDGDLKALRELRREMQDGWNRDQQAWLRELRRADRAEARLRYFGHDVPGDEAPHVESGR